jgi:Zn-dependent peptidase ImmA (M78 family)
MALDLIRERAAERRADLLISELQITDAGEIDVDAIAMTRGALVVDGGLTGAEARLTRSPKLNFIRVNTGIRESGRRRFAIAHELGHLLLQQTSQFALCTDKDLLPFYTNNPDELEASVFAAALLMPTKMFQPLCQTSAPSLKYVAELAQRFQVTLTAAATRYIQFCPHRCCLVASTDGKIRYHRKTDDFAIS